ncbi:5214_t:CDS:2 [Funneliformis mosseae]|uniref:5214_t:CDS:1 n=1 Tax=Funneliformis mosseae TaxID=27381 RepID=A0A9N9DXN2_FUNMO|nr:5214_t:CDS:2 [Funneliformis mosseae]
MEISFPKVINEVIENIILSTDNNNQRLFNTGKDNTTNTFNMKIDNIAFSTSNFTEKNNFSYADAIKSKLNINNTSSPLKGNINRNSNNSSNTVNAIQSLIVRIDDINNKLVLLSDEIIFIKNEILQQHHNQGDIDYHLSKLEIFTQILDDDDKELLMNIDKPKDTVQDTNIDNIGTLQKDEIAILRITQIEHELKNLRSELKSILLALRQALLTINLS